MNNHKTATYPPPPTLTTGINNITSGLTNQEIQQRQHHQPKTTSSSEVKRAQLVSDMDDYDALMNPPGEFVVLGQCCMRPKNIIYFDTVKETDDDNKTQYTIRVHLHNSDVNEMSILNAGTFETRDTCVDALKRFNAILKKNFNAKIRFMMAKENNSDVSDPSALRRDPYTDVYEEYDRMSRRRPERRRYRYGL